MATTGVGRDQILKAQRLDREWLAKKRLDESREIDNYDEYDKIDYEIAKLKNTISLADLDLNTSWGKNNPAILKKKQIAEYTLHKLLPRFEKLKQQREERSKNEK